MTTTADVRGDADDAHYLFERYVARAASGERSGSAALRAYYAVRPLIPRHVQIAMRRVYARKQAKATFPHWPIEPILVDRQHEALRARLPQHGPEGVPLVNFWPGAHRFAFVLTHDVEGVKGVENIPRLLEIEQRHGVVSSWNFCAEEYPIADGTFDLVREAGCEIGLHAVDHKCKLFSSRERFVADLPKIHRYMEEWGAVGFRSPALHRNADWMPELGCLYDSSYPDTDPFEPQAGGCCSILPFLNGDMVELPVTLVQDHTLWEILRHDDIEPWTSKSRWIADNRGLVNVIVHPDYLLRQDRLDAYEALIVFLKGLQGGWHALPRDVAAWWKAREELRIEAGPEGGHVVAGGDGTWDARVAYAREGEGDRIVFSVA